MVAGSLMNFLVISKISGGMVAENSPTWISPGIKEKISLI